MAALQDRRNREKAKFEKKVIIKKEPEKVNRRII